VPESGSGAQTSPPWSPTTKLLAGITFLVVVVALVRQYHFILGPLLGSFVLVYLLHAPSRILAQNTRLGWTGAVNVVFLVVLLLALTVLSFVGVTAADQGLRLANVMSDLADELPAAIESLPRQVRIMSFDVDIAQLPLYEGLRSMSGNLGQAAAASMDLVTGLVTGVITLLVTAVFVLVITYFILQSAGEDAGATILNFRLPDERQNADLRRMRRELSRIWRAYLGGQVTLSLLSFVLYLAFLSILGVQEALGLSVLAALARFVPYVGAAVTWSVATVVVLLQGGSYAGLDPWAHVALVLAVLIVVDLVLDQYVMPRVMSSVLGVHPAAVMVAAIGATKVLGLIGLVLAAPVLASGWLATRYAGRKMLDMDPWPEPAVQAEPDTSLGSALAARLARLRER